MAMGVRAAQMAKPKLMIALMLITILFGFGFLGIKAVEYHEHWVHHEFPGPNFHFDTDDPAHPATDPQHTEIYFSLYWAMTGLHALHMVIGIGLVDMDRDRGIYGNVYSRVLQSGGKRRTVLALC